MTTVWNLVAAIPSAIKLLLLLDARIKEAGIERKVSEDVNTIHDAFDSKDPSKLDALFNS